MRIRRHLMVIAAASTLAACAGTGAWTEDMADHGTAPGHAFGSAPPHVVNSAGGGPEVHYPTPAPGSGTRIGRVATIVGGGGEGGPQVTHSGPGSGNAGFRRSGRIIGNAGSEGGPIVEHGHEPVARWN